ncbi:MAG: ATP-binding protein [Halobacteriota archaeon]
MSVATVASTIADLGRPLYLGAFGLAAVLCLLSSISLRGIPDEHTRRGLLALVLLSGAWAASHVGYLAASTASLQYAMYLLGLIVGFAAVGAWLYFCASYTGRAMHHDPLVRWVAVAVFVGVIAVKVTNPWHGWYFTATAVTTPFPYLRIDHSTLHWVSMGLSYALAFLGFFMLFELFHQVRHDTRPLVILVLLTGTPVLLDVVAPLHGSLLVLTYSPLGVAVFAIGVAFVYRERFERIHLAGTREEPIVVLDEAGHVRDFNASATELIPNLAAAVGDPFDEAFPRVAEALETEAVLDVWDGTDVSLYRVGSNPFAAGRTQLGEIVMFTDVTEAEEHRIELERQNQRLENFASMVSHDLRNPLTVALGHLELVQDERDDEHVDTAMEALDRMNTLIEDMLVLARTGQPIDEPQPVSLVEVVERCWSVVSTGDVASLEVGKDLRFLADPDRLQQLFENLVRNAIDHGEPPVTVWVGALPDGRGFFVEDDGPGIPPESRERVLESGFSTRDDGTGFGLAIVREIADAHGWTVTIEEGRTGGARFEIGGVQVVS